MTSIAYMFTVIIGNLSSSYESEDTHGDSEEEAGDHELTVWKR